MIRREDGSMQIDHRRLFRDMPVGLMIAGPDGVIIDINEYCLELAGFASREEAIGANSLELNDDTEHMQSILERLKTDDRIENELVCVRRRDGALRWARNDVFVRRDDSGAPLFFESAFIDVTHEQQYLILLDLQRELSGLLSHTIDSVDACGKILDYCLSLPGVDTGAVYMLDIDGENLDLVAHRNISEPLRKQIALVPVDYIKNRFPDLQLHVTHVSEAEFRNDLMKHEGFHSLIYAFVVWKGELIGCINLASTTRDEMPGLTIEFLKLMSDHVAANMYRLYKMRLLERQEMFYRTMFQESPVVMLNIDMSELLRLLQEIDAASNDTDLHVALQDLELMKRLVRSANILSYNREFFSMMETSPSQLEGESILAYAIDETLEDLAYFFSELYAGHTQYEMETTIKTGRGHQKRVFLKFVLVPGRENDWGSIMLSVMDISELTESIDALRDSLMYNRGLLMAIPDMFLVLDSNRMIAEYKEPAGVTLNFDVADILHRDLTSLKLDEDDYTALDNLVTRAQEHNKAYRMRLGVSSLQGDRVFETRIAPLGDEQVLILARDITDYEDQMQRRLEAEADLLRALQIQEVLAEVSREFSRFEGLDIEQQMKRIGEAMNLDVVSFFLRDSDNVSLRYSWVFDTEFQLRDKLQKLDVTKFAWWMSQMSALSPVTIEDVATMSQLATPERELMQVAGLTAVTGMPLLVFGELVGFVVFGILHRTHKWTHQEQQMLRIFTELVTNWMAREKTTESLRESEEQFRNLAEQSPNMIFINQGGRVVFANQECERLMGYTREEFYASDFNFMSLIHPSSQLLVRRNFQRHSKGEEVKPYEYRLVCKDGSRRDSILSSKLVAYGGEPALMGIITDITARKAMEMQLRRINEDLEQFVYVASHDLQEPLRGISSYMEMLQERYSPQLDAKGRLFIERAGLAADRLQEMIDGLLAYSRITSHEVPDEKIDLNKILDEVFDSMPKLQGALIQRGGLPSVRGDATQIQSVFRNLLSNAVKYCTRKPKISIYAVSSKTRHTISIQDNGIGIPEAYLEEVFDIFRRLHTYDAYPGSGIGLSMCLKIMERHGGLIRVESQVDKGSTFIIEFPVE